MSDESDVKIMGELCSYRIAVEALRDLSSCRDPFLMDIVVDKLKKLADNIEPKGIKVKIWRQEVNIAEIMRSAAEDFKERKDREARSTLNVFVIPVIPCGGME